MAWIDMNVSFYLLYTNIYFQNKTFIYISCLMFCVHPQEVPLFRWPSHVLSWQNEHDLTHRRPPTTHQLHLKWYRAFWDYIWSLIPFYFIAFVSFPICHSVVLLGLNNFYCLCSGFWSLQSLLFGCLLCWWLMHIIYSTAIYCPSIVSCFGCVLYALYINVNPLYDLLDFQTPPQISSHTLHAFSISPRPGHRSRKLNGGGDGRRIFSEDAESLFQSVEVPRSLWHLLSGISSPSPPDHQPGLHDLPAQLQAPSSLLLARLRRVRHEREWIWVSPLQGFSTGSRVICGGLGWSGRNTVK